MERNPERLHFLGATVEVLVAAEETDGAWSLISYAVPGGFRGPAPHWHARTVEVLYPVSGRLLLRSAGGQRVLGPGEVAMVPPGEVHAYANPGTEPALVRVLFTPGGFEGFFREVARVVAQAPTWPPVDLSRLMALAERYDTFAPGAEAGARSLER
jgi:mannose-6-phosphate isomerase-like protein (cupin superfamily)